MFDYVIPTPIIPLRYSDNLNQFYIKRDDLLPFSFGGNKARIANEYFKDMIEKGYDCIISYGNSRSNLNRVIANMSKALGFLCYVVSPIDDSEEIIETNNSRLTKLFDAKIIHCNKNKVSETIEYLIRECKSKGLNPYYINGNKYGKGNEKVAVMAYAKVYEEILNYEKEIGLSFDYIFHASGTGITQAGLMCGKLKNNDKKEIVGISIARNYDVGKSAIVNNIMSYFENNLLDGDGIDKEVNFEDKYICGGYGKYNKEIVKTISELIKIDGIPLDLTYTGKAFWGMTEYVREKKITNAKILFIHTGGTPLFFDDLMMQRL